MTSGGNGVARRIDARDDSLGAVVDRRLSGRFVVDPWGLDDDLRRLAAGMARWRWATSLDGADLLPRGSALLVHDQGVDPATPLVLATAVGRHAGRTVRPVGLPDRSPLGPLLARVGVVPRTEGDVRSLLRAGELVSVALGRPPRGGRPSADLGLVAAAHAVGAPLVPVSVGGRPFGRRRPVVVGAPVPTARRRLVGAVETLAEEVADRVGALAQLAAVED